MEQLVTVQIDGKTVEVPAGMNLIDAAERAGVHIPNLCYMKGMKGVGACRLCLVEVEGLKAPVIACNTKVRDGMVVSTKTDKVQEVRKFVIDLLISMHPLDCMTCTKAGICNLQKYAYEFELKESTFSRKKFGYPVDQANPFIQRDPDYCILCGRCVRVCREQGTNVLDFMGRGIGSKVITANDGPLQESACTFCGTCVDACPVNALLESDRWRRGREWEYEKTDSVCLLCGNGCLITVSARDGKVQKINAGAPEGSVERYLCAYGRFGFDGFEGGTRLASPLVRDGGELKETSWEEALSRAASKLKETGKNAGFISTAGIPNEDALSLGRFAADVVRTPHLDTTLSLYGDGDVFKKSQTADLDTADLMLLVDLNPSQWDRVFPALDAAIRRRVDRGAKLIVINEKDTKIGSIATVNLRGDEASLLKSLAKALIGKGIKANKSIEESVKDAEITEETEKAAALIIDAHEPVIFSSPSLFDAAANIALLKGKIIAVPLESNARGIVSLGLKTEGRTYKEMTGRTGIKEQGAKSAVKVLYAVGEVPLQKRPEGVEFLIVQNSHLTDLAQQADIVLPSAVFLESGGTIVDYLGRIKHLKKCSDPPENSKNHRDIFLALAKALGRKFKQPTEAEIKKAAKVKTKIASSPFIRREGFEISPGDFIESVNASVINGSRLLWLREAREATTV
ncbi:MAG: molybdopterin-dependent oxidoreductase [Nitrospirota bacterium]